MEGGDEASTSQDDPRSSPSDPVNVSENASTGSSAPPEGLQTGPVPPSSADSPPGLSIDTSTAQRKSQQPHKSSTTSTSSTSSQQPTSGKLDEPFPPSGTYPDTRSPHPSHPDAENLVNTAARHVFPADPAPGSAPSDKGKGVTKEGRISPGDRDGTKMRDDKVGRDEEPLIGGTPLDEMTPVKTPGVFAGSHGPGGFPFPPKPSASRQMSSSTIKGVPKDKNREGSGDTLMAVPGAIPPVIPEDEQLKADPTSANSTLVPPVPPPAAKPQRPTLQTSELGSVSASV